MAAAGFAPRNDGIHYRIASVNYNTFFTPGTPTNQSEPYSSRWPASEAFTIGDTPVRVSSIIKNLDYIINMPVIKHHDDAGITFALKNFYGVIDNPGGLHANMCDAVSQVYQKVAGKTKLIVGDGFLGACNTGPSTGPDPDWIPGQVIAGTDPVAVDSYVLDQINQQRAAHNYPPVPYSATGNMAHPDARHIFTAARTYNLGSICFQTVSAPVTG